MSSKPFFYKKLVAVARYRKISLRKLAAILEVDYNSFLKQLRREGRRDLSSNQVPILMKVLAPADATDDDLLPEAIQNAYDHIKSRLNT